MAENATLFVVYGELQNVIRKAKNKPSNEKLSLPELALAAAGAGGVTSFILCVLPALYKVNPSVNSSYRTPIELVKCKMQVQMLSTNPATLANLPGPITVFTSVIRTTGVRGLWLGHTGTFIRETGGGAAWFGTKEFVASRLLERHVDPKDTQLRPWESAFSGACAGAAFNVALFPADTVKSAIQTEEELHGTRSGPKSTFLGTFKAMYKARGIRGLYAGCGITIARSIPSSALIFLMYDELNKWFG